MATADGDEFQSEVGRAVMVALERGVRSFHDVLAMCEGADPHLVNDLYQRSKDSGSGTPPAIARRESSELAAVFPVSDPVACQWWFTLDTIERLANRAYQSVYRDDPVAFIGAPTVAFQYGRRFGSATVFELDKHIIATLAARQGIVSVEYDAGDPLPGQYQEQFAAVVIDPPWYPELIRAFIQRALEAARPGASVFCSLPPRLTRPGIAYERQSLLKDLVEARLDIVSIEPSTTRYLVPLFERVAMQDILAFDGRPWRAGDLLHLRKTNDSRFTGPSIPRTSVTSFARNAKQYRVFLRDDSAPDLEAATFITSVPEFERTVSRRHVDPTTLHWWTSDKRGGRLRDLEVARMALELWQSGLTRQETVKALEDRQVKSQDAHGICRDLEDCLALWTKHGERTVRVRPGEFKSNQGSQFACQVSEARPYPRENEDGYRAPFQRDRDRITWSRGLRQLANKTQVFPLVTDDFLRNRLSHSLEVTQLAMTIGASFGLNPNLIEAGAMAHDIGHTPFGHAGEDALHRLFGEVESELGGFNHYEHGVDVVRWLEDAYQSPALGGVPGLNISAEVAECIFKHTYCTSGAGFSQAEIFKNSKHQEYFDGRMCHVEGQAVRVADKVSYLISDIEDGIRLGALRLEDVRGCQLLQRPPLDFVLSENETLHERYLSQRGLLIGFLMEDIIEHTDRMLARAGSVSAVRNADTYTVNHSPEIAEEVSEVWMKLQAGKLHKDARVRMANLRAARIVRELTVLLAVAPELIEYRFSEAHKRLHSTQYLDFYRKRVGRKVKLKSQMLDFVVADGGRALGFSPGHEPEIAVEQLVQSKDYVAGLSDARAEALHRALLRV